MRRLRYFGIGWRFRDLALTSGGRKVHDGRVINSHPTVIDQRRGGDAGGDLLRAVEPPPGEGANVHDETDRANAHPTIVRRRRPEIHLRWRLHVDFRSRKWNRGEKFLAQRFGALSLLRLGAP